MNKNWQIIKSVARHPVTIISAVIGLFVVLQVSGLLIPLIRMALLLFVSTGLLGSVYACWRLVQAAREPDRVTTDRTGWILTVLGCGGMTLVCGLMLLLIPNSTDARTAEDSASSSSPVGSTASGAENPVSAPQDAPQLATDSKEEARSHSPPTPDDDQADQDAAEFLGTLFGAAARQQAQQSQSSEYQDFQRSINRLRQCATCGGAGVYRYVDGRGTLQVNNCPRCNGSGKAY